ncbi:MAG: hypothetical protein JWR77_1308 [Rhizorhabdus sp.]|nr:hypothetical protein [Rhizorhabdus sp.]
MFARGLIGAIILAGAMPAWSCQPAPVGRPLAANLGLTPESSVSERLYPAMSVSDESWEILVPVMRIEADRALPRARTREVALLDNRQG